MYGCGEQEAGVASGEGGIYGCGCKEVYRFPHTTYPYFSVLFAAASLLFVLFLFSFSFFYIINFYAEAFV